MFAWGTPDVAWGTPDVAWGTPEVAWGTPEVAWGTPDVAWGIPREVQQSHIQREVKKWYICRKAPPAVYTTGRSI